METPKRLPLTLEEELRLATYDPVAKARVLDFFRLRNNPDFRPNAQLIRLYTQPNPALVLDFEGFKEGPPLMGGVLLDGEYFCTVFPDEYPLMRLAAVVKGLGVMARARYLSVLVAGARREKRPIVAFSNHEKQVIEDADISLQDVAYIDVRTTAKVWRRQNHKEIHSRVVARRRWRREHGRFVGDLGNSLIDYVKLLGEKVPANYGKGKTTKRLRAILDQLERHGEYSRLTPHCKRNWTNVIEHNRLDCIYTDLLYRKTAG